MHKNLFIVGAQKSATTYIAKLLSEHPNVYMVEMDQCVDSVSKALPEPKYFYYEEEKEAYLKKYFKDKEEIIVGEKSVVYLEYDFIANRIKNCFPDAIIVIILRDPVLRAISHYFYSVREGIEKRGMEEAIFGEPLKYPKSLTMSPYLYLERSKYTQYIERYKKLFDNVHILITEEFANNLNGIQNFYKELGLNDNLIPPSWNKQINALTKEEISDKIICKVRGYLADSIIEVESCLKRNLDIWK